MNWVIVVLIWLVLGIPAFGWTFAYFQGEYPTIAQKDKREDYGLATALFLAGPIGLLAAFLSSGFGKHGWRIR